MPNQTSRSDASLTCSANQEMLPEYPLVKILTCVRSYDEAVWAPFWRIPNWTLNHVSCLREQLHCKQLSTRASGKLSWNDNTRTYHHSLSA